MMHYLLMKLIALCIILLLVETYSYLVDFNELEKVDDINSYRLVFSNVSDLVAVSKDVKVSTSSHRRRLVDEPSSQPSAQPSSEPSISPTTQPSLVPVSNPSTQPSSEPSTAPSNQPSSQPSARPLSHPSTQPSSRPSNQPTSVPVSNPSTQPSSRPSTQPSSEPSTAPSNQPSSQPSARPFSHPSAQPSSRPSDQPTSKPITCPSTQPSSSPSTIPSMQPTCQPSSYPSNQPSVRPSSQPSAQPTFSPSIAPTSQPSTQPSAVPSGQPSGSPSTCPSSRPSSQPSHQPSTNPTSLPSGHPSQQPSSQPTTVPSISPIGIPTSQPTSQPSLEPSTQPSSAPSAQPSSQPTTKPSEQPTGTPSISPTSQPSSQPSGVPSNEPSVSPSSQPSTQPSTDPSSQPSGAPSMQPFSLPSSFPSSQPTIEPSSQPSTSPSAQPSDVPSSQPSTLPSTQPSGLPSQQPVSLPSSSPTVQPTGKPSTQPSTQPSGEPSCLPSSQPSCAPTVQPSSHPSLQPTSQPTVRPSNTPSTQPTAQPSSDPSSQPSSQPSVHPSSQPSIQPSSSPSGQPSVAPSTQPSCFPTTQPSTQPSSQPSAKPLCSPSAQPSSKPSSQPSGQPSQQPITAPSGQPSAGPSTQPSGSPSVQPSTQPTTQPSTMPTGRPSQQPTSQPSNQPSIEPTIAPSVQPSCLPSSQPSMMPSGQPSSYPTSQPSMVPTIQPSSKPSLQPSSVPTSQPTVLPSTQPTSLPSSQPSSQPVSVPSCQPSSSPSRQPSSKPSGCPSSQPTSQPSRRPTSQPSRLPSSHPSGQPSRLPSSQPLSVPTTQPSARPSKQPFGSPSSQPSRLPSSQPSMCPSLQPNSHPTGLPSSQPSNLPSLQPFSCPSCQPSTQPTSKPSATPNCTDGQYYTYDGTNGAFVCHNCATGYFNPRGQPSRCTEADPGHFAAAGSAEQTVCPVNTYGLGVGKRSRCEKCPLGSVSDLMSTNKSACTNATSSFSIAFIGLGVCLFGIFLYIIGGRLHRMAFVRREIPVKNATKVFNIVCEKLMFLTDYYQVIAFEKLKKESLLFKVMKSILAIVLVLVVFFGYVLVSVYHIFYTTVILYRGYVAVPISINVPPLFSQLEVFISSLTFHVPYVTYVFYPFIFLYSILSNVNIDLSEAQVSCQGAQIPMHLLIDCFVVGIAVLVIESDMEVFWCVPFSNVHQEFRKLLLRREYWEGRIIQNFLFGIWSIILQFIPHPRSFLQFGLGFVRVTVFFNHTFSKNCNVAPFKFVDSTLALLSTVIAAFTLFPVLYIFAQILVPTFKLDWGTVKREKHINRRLILTDTSERHSCGVCQRFLVRYYSDYFGDKFECKHPDCKCPIQEIKRTKSVWDKVSGGRGKPSKIVFYGCPSFKGCEYAICISCGNVPSASENFDFNEHDDVEPSSLFATTPQDTMVPVIVPEVVIVSDGGEDEDEANDTTSPTQTTEKKPSGQQLQSNDSSSTPTSASGAKSSKKKNKSGRLITTKIDNVEEINDHDYFWYQKYNQLAQNPKKERPVITYCGQKSKYMAIFLSIDWFYLKHAFAFAKSLLPKLPVLEGKGEHKTIVKSPPEIVELPVLPWYQARMAKDSKEVIAMEHNWTTFIADFPSYHRMILTVQDDLMPIEEHRVMCNACLLPIVGKRYTCVGNNTYNLCEYCEICSVKATNFTLKMKLHEDSKTWFRFFARIFVVFISWTIIGQLYSERGRKIWWRVLNNYRVFLYVTLNTWTGYESEHFGLKERFEDLQVNDPVITQPKNNWDYDQFPAFNDANEEDERLQLMSALVAPRVVLLQLVPYLTVFSSFAVDVCSSPIHVVDEKLLKVLPPLFHIERLDDHARQLLLDIDIEPKFINRHFIRWYLFMRRSRGIQFIKNGVSNIVAVVLVFSRRMETIQSVAIFTALFLCFFAFFEALYYIVYLMNVICPSPKQDRHHVESGQGHVVVGDNHGAVDIEAGINNENTFDDDLIGLSALQVIVESTPTSPVDTTPTRLSRKSPHKSPRRQSTSQINSFYVVPDEVLLSTQVVESPRATTPPSKAHKGLFRVIYANSWKKSSKHSGSRSGVNSDRFSVDVSSNNVDSQVIISPSSDGNLTIKQEGRSVKFQIDYDNVSVNGGEFKSDSNEVAVHQDREMIVLSELDDSTQLVSDNDAAEPSDLVVIETPPPTVTLASTATASPALLVNTDVSSNQSSNQSSSAPSTSTSGSNRFSLRGAPLGLVSSMKARFESKSNQSSSKTPQLSPTNSPTFTMIYEDPNTFKRRRSMFDGSTSEKPKKKPITNAAHRHSVSDGAMTIDPLSKSNSFKMMGMNPLSVSNVDAPKPPAVDESMVDITLIHSAHSEVKSKENPLIFNPEVEGNNDKDGAKLFRIDTTKPPEEGLVDITAIHVDHSEVHSKENPLVINTEVEENHDKEDEGSNER